MSCDRTRARSLPLSLSLALFSTETSSVRAARIAQIQPGDALPRVRREGEEEGVEAEEQSGAAAEVAKTWDQATQRGGGGGGRGGGGGGGGGGAAHQHPPPLPPSHQHPPPLPSQPPLPPLPPQVRHHPHYPHCPRRPHCLSRRLSRRLPYPATYPTPSPTTRAAYHLHWLHPSCIPPTPPTLPLPPTPTAASPAVSYFCRCFRCHFPLLEWMGLLSSPPPTLGLNPYGLHSTVYTVPQYDPTNSHVA
jgi:hypothetical protein